MEKYGLEIVLMTPFGVEKPAHPAIPKLHNSGKPYPYILAYDDDNWVTLDHHIHWGLPHALEENEVGMQA